MVQPNSRSVRQGPIPKTPRILLETGVHEGIVKYLFIPSLLTAAAELSWGFHRSVLQRRDPIYLRVSELQIVLLLSAEHTNDNSTLLASIPERSVCMCTANLYGDL